MDEEGNSKWTRRERKRNKKKKMKVDGAGLKRTLEIIDEKDKKKAKK